MRRQPQQVVNFLRLAKLTTGHDVRIEVGSPSRVITSKMARDQGMSKLGRVGLCEDVGLLYDEGELGFAYVNSAEEGDDFNLKNYDLCLKELIDTAKQTLIAHPYDGSGGPKPQLSGKQPMPETRLWALLHELAVNDSELATEYYEGTLSTKKELVAAYLKKGSGGGKFGFDSAIDALLDSGDDADLARSIKHFGGDFADTFAQVA